MTEMGLGIAAPDSVHGEFTGSEYNKRDESRQYNDRKPQFHVLSQGQKPFWCIHQKYRSDQDRQLDDAGEAGVYPQQDHRSAQNVRERHVVCDTHSREMLIKPGGGDLQRIDVRDEEEPFVGDKQSENDTK